MNKNNYNLAIFEKSIIDIKKEKSDFGSEIAFVGYSNSGKSTLINVLTNQKKLARISKVPGRTQSINIFKVSSKVRLVDLPGYGYARVPESIRLQLKHIVFQYLKLRKCLKGLVMLIDIRCSIKNLDETVINLAKLRHIPMFILLNKSDKVSFEKRKRQLHIMKNNQLVLSHNIQVELFSSLKSIEMNSLRDKIGNWICKIV
ncbi:MAG: ribosome biogenesis GTP-binding protein YihA/YsxC [Buchnera aphidicola (Meitanaphis microgallis)]